MDLGIVVSILAVAGGGYYIYDKKKRKDRRRNRIKADRHQSEVERAFAAARSRLVRVGAPVQDFSERRVKFVRGTVKVKHGWGIMKGSQSVGGLTLGKNVTMVEKPNGQPQSLLWELEACHSWLPGRVESAHYEWIDRAYPEWR